MQRLGECESASATVRGYMPSSERVRELERKLERLERENRMLSEQLAEVRESVRSAEAERARREAPLSKRLKWFVFGREPGA